MYTDVEETVVAKVLASLTSLVELGLFQKLRIWELVSAATGFLCHPNVWIRQGVNDSHARLIFLLCELTSLALLRCVGYL